MSKQQYDSLKKKIVLVMAAAAIAPLILLAGLNLFEFQATFTRESEAPFRSIVNKTKNSFELFLAERKSTVSFIASIYSYQDLADTKTLQRIFLSMQKEFPGFVDLGLVSSAGTLVSYAGPHQELKGVNYSKQAWFSKVQSQSHYVSEVFKGFRNIPHVIIAVQHFNENGESWVVRATLDTSQFRKLISGMGLPPGSDAFLVSRDGILQTDSAYYGKSLEKVPVKLPLHTSETQVLVSDDSDGNTLLLSACSISDTDFILIAYKPIQSLFNNWLMLRTDILAIFCISALAIYFTAAIAVGKLIKRLQDSDTEREAAIMQMEHSHKLSSIGRLAAGISHEINNPLAIINEKAGLLCDLLEIEKEFPRREQFSSNLRAISAAVSRCRDITHRMLGFARRMDIQVEELDANAVVKETLLFLEKEAVHRNIRLTLELDDKLPRIECDRGQLQQVFLNILNNALAAVNKDGAITISSGVLNTNQIEVSFTDSGCGMSDETCKHIFEPFFTTKKNEGTGLGLSIIYGIVKRLGGDILVESKENEGSVFRVVLPVHQKLEEKKT